MVKERLSLGIELGSTRVKCVLLKEGRFLASGESRWENVLVEGLYSYGYDRIVLKLQEAYADLKEDYRKKTGLVLKEIDSMGVSAMMHGYLPLGEDFRPISFFRTWRNTNTKEAAAYLSELFGFNIPERWSIAHLYEAMLRHEEHLRHLKHLTTLAGYVHYLLTQRNVLGIGDASGMFPIRGKTFDPERIRKFEETALCQEYGFSLLSLLPEILMAREEAGRLTSEGALLLDPSGVLLPGTRMAPPEGDAQTGMVATNAILPGKGNVSIGTSIFLMAVLNKGLESHERTIDIVSTPDGKDCAMIHANNCATDLDQWMSLFRDYDELCGAPRTDDDRYRLLFSEAMKSDGDLQIYSYNLYSGEPILKVEDGKPMVVRDKEGKLDLRNFMLSLLYPTFNTIALGMAPLRKEHVRIDSLVGQGGLFKTEGVLSELFASALDIPLITYEKANEGGPYGMALLSYYLFFKDEPLFLFLERMFKDIPMRKTLPDAKRHESYVRYLENYERNLALERVSVKTKSIDSSYCTLKEEAYKANLFLVEHGLVVLTWGNASAYDPERKVLAIKPSGVDYKTMKAEDMVIVDQDGNVLEGSLRPSSDLKTHLEIYKSFPNIRGVVHTHSTFATAFAQAGLSIPCYGTTHADYFYGSVPCARELTKEEIDDDYERNTGKVIVEHFLKNAIDPEAVGAILLKSHGVFTFAPTVEKATENALVLEEIAKMAYLSRTLSPDLKEASAAIQDKHYHRKHGKNAYYGQKKD